MAYLMYHGFLITGLVVPTAITRDEPSRQDYKFVVVPPNAGASLFWNPMTPTATPPVYRMAGAPSTQVGKTVKIVGY